MVVSKLTQILSKNVILSASKRPSPMILTKRFKPHYKSGALKPMPNVVPFGVFGVFLTVLIGLSIGATISKNIANFLEENDLFVPDDDDEDD